MVSNPSRPGPLSSGPMGRMSPALNLQYRNGNRYPEIDFNKMMSISTPEAAVRKGGFASPFFGNRCYIQGQNVAAWEPSPYCGNPSGGNLAEGGLLEAKRFSTIMAKNRGQQLLSIDI